MNMVFTLLIIFQLKHFLADYPLQTPYMLGKFKSDWSFFWPLYSHAWVHGTLSLLIAFTYTHDITFSIRIYMIDMVIHFLVDRMKAGPKYLGRFKDMYEKKFWWCLGFDQMIHHLTHYLLIFLIMEKMK